MGADLPTFPRWITALQRAKPALGITVTLPDPSVAEVIAASGADWIMVDLEHSSCTTRDVESITLAAHSLGVPVLARVAENRLDDVQHVLDAGAAGIVVPRVGSAAEANGAVEHARYPPDGRRGFGPRRANRYGLDRGYVEWANSGLAVVIQLEDVNALSELKDILATPVSAIYIGPNDLAASMGLLGQPGHRDVIDVILRVIDEALVAGKPVGVAVGDAAGARPYTDRGADFLGIAGDIWLLGAAVASAIERHRTSAEGRASEG
jgi:2-keto-3-deoxy-L-rhamnonate aldolase RhmA